ncbi:hypothetical protein D3C77_531200 [compost metagenome]
MTQSEIQHFTRRFGMHMYLYHFIISNDDNRIPIYRQRFPELIFVKWRVFGITKCTIDEKFHVVQKLNILRLQSSLS